MKSQHTLSRRTLLRGIAAGAAAALALPPLEAMLNGNGTAYADGTPLPKRFGVWFWGNGCRPDRWVPGATGMGWTPSPELMPLNDVRDAVTVVSGMEMKLTGTGHHVGRAGMLTGSFIDMGMPNSSHWGQPGGPSVDQIVARAWSMAPATMARFRSLEIGVSIRGKGNGGEGGSTSWNGPNMVNPAEMNPQRLYDRLFGMGTPMAAQEAEHLRRARRSALDVVLADANDLRRALGRGDQARLDAHLDGLRSIETQLASMPATCGSPTRPGPTGTEDPGHEMLVEKNQVMADILVAALACDLTRVFTFQFTGMQTDTIFWQTGATEGMHVMTHDDRGLAEMLPPQIEGVHRATTFIMERFAYLVRALKNVRVGAGTLLDQCAVMATSELSDGTEHSYRDMPLLIAGGGGGALRTGLHYRSTTRENTSQVLFSLLRAMGLPVTEFGQGAAHVTSGLAAIERA